MTYLNIKLWWTSRTEEERNLKDRLVSELAKHFPTASKEGRVTFQISECFVTPRHTTRRYLIDSATLSKLRQITIQDGTSRNMTMICRMLVHTSPTGSSRTLSLPHALAVITLTRSWALT